MSRGAMSYAAIGAMALVSTSALGGMTYLAYQDSQTLKPDLVGCYVTPHASDQTVLIVDSSEPRFDAVQSADLQAAISDVYEHDLAFNENLKIVTTEKPDIGSVPRPVLDICAGAKTSAEREAIGASGASQAFLDRQRQRTYDDRVSPVLQQVFATSVHAAVAQDRESPIFEQIQSVSAMREMEDRGQDRTLILVSDLIQHTQEMQACTTQGHLPRFERFEATPYYSQIKPRSLNGVTVKIYQIVRPGLGRGTFQYCTQDELVRFWTAYFEAAGARPEFIRLRDGAYVTSDGGGL